MALADPTLLPSRRLEVEQKGGNGVSLRNHMVPGLMLVLALALITRISGVVNTNVIQRDGVTFLNMAQQLLSDSVRAVAQHFDQHLGYPALVSAIHRVLGLPDTVETWERCGQWVSVCMGTLASLGVWALSGLALNWRIAWISGSLFAVGRKWSMLGADVMSDASALCLIVWGVVCAILACGDRGRVRGWGWTVGWAVLAGLCSGAAFTIRPEGVGAALVALGLWLLWAILRRFSLRRAVVACVACIVGLAAVAGPYVCATGAITKKTHPAPTAMVWPVPMAMIVPAMGSPLGSVASASRLLLEALLTNSPATGEAARPGTGMPASLPATAATTPVIGAESEPSSGPPGPTRGPASHFATGQAMFVQTIEALHPVNFGLVCFWLLAVGYHFYLPPQRRQQHLKFPHGAGGFGLVVMLGLYLTVMAVLRLRAGYLDWRHCMAAAFALAPLTGAGLVAVFDFVTERLGGALKVAHPDRFQRNAWIICFPLIIASVGFTSLRPLHGGNDYVREAGRALRAAAKRDDDVSVTNLNWVLHYARVKGTVVESWNVANVTFLAKIEALSPRPTLLALSDRYLPTFEPPMPGALTEPRFEKIGTFKQKNDSDGSDVVHLYRIHWDQPWTPPAPH